MPNVIIGVSEIVLSVNDLPLMRKFYTSMQSHGNHVLLDQLLAVATSAADVFKLRLHAGFNVQAAAEDLGNSGSHLSI